LLLEEKSGHFLEAAELARSWGDLLEEADLLEKAGHFKEAGLLLHWYVYFSSLRGNGNRGWPPKQFAQKEELCNKVKLLAKMDSDVMYDFVCSELKTPSYQHISLSELKKDLYFSQKNSSLRGEILLIRKILDKHLHMDSSKYDWEDNLPVDIYKHCEDKINSLEGSTMYLSLNKDADWIRNTDNKGLHKDRKRIAFDGRELVFAIRSYWQSELLSVGIKVLQTFDTLRKSKSNGSVFHQSTSLLHIFEVSKLAEISRRELGSLKETDLSVNLLEEIILQAVDIKALERVIKICLCSRVSVPVYENLINKLKIKPQFKSFVEKFRDGGLKDVLVAPTLERALEDNFKVASGFLSPHSFGYLLDRLLLMQTFTSENSYTTRSFVGSFTHIQSASTLSIGPSSLNLSIIVERIADILYYNEITVVWIQRNKIDASYYPLLVLKMVMILSLICLKAPNYSPKLHNFLCGLDNIACFLPKKFVRGLLRKRKNHKLNLDPEVKSKEEIMSVLFPRKNTHNVHSSSDNVTAGTIPELLSSDTLQHTNIMNRVELQMNWKVLEEISKVINGKKGVALNKLPAATMIKVIYIRAKAIND
ncbi:hypothetical protein Tco_0633639, partial [Tanacetum coccineum]